MSHRLARPPRRPVGRNLFVVAALVLGAGFAASCGGERAGAARRAPGGAVSVVELEVEGMTCTGCAAGIQSALGKVPGVVEAAVDFESGRARVTVAGADADPAVLVAAIGKAGPQYRARAIAPAGAEHEEPAGAEDEEPAGAEDGEPAAAEDGEPAAPRPAVGGDGT